MSAGHRQRGPQEGHSTMEEGEEMRKEENGERTREFKQNDMEEGTGAEDGVGEGRKQVVVMWWKREPIVYLWGLYFVRNVQIGNILIVQRDGWVGGGRKDCSK